VLGIFAMSQSESREYDLVVQNRDPSRPSLHDENDNDAPTLGIAADKSCLRVLDKDGDGRIDQEELVNFVKGHQAIVREKDLLMKFLIGLFSLLIVFAAVICVGTWLIVDLTKEVAVNDDDNVLRGGKGDNMVVTDNPRYYTTLSDIALLSPAALNSLQRLSFVTEDGKSHNYMIEGWWNTEYNILLNSLHSY
jgi:hypothetical protein